VHHSVRMVQELYGRGIPQSQLGFAILSDDVKIEFALG
jgi:hypothetical protein